MKNFLKWVLISGLGTFLGLALMSFIFFSIIVSPSNWAEGEEDGNSIDSKDSMVLTFKLHGKLVERLDREDQLSQLLTLKGSSSAGLFRLTQVLREATTDKKIKGLFLDLRGFYGPMALVEALHREVLRFKKSGKFVLAYGDFYTERSYLLASAADELVLYPQGYMEWNGVAARLTFLKKTLNKLEVFPQVFRMGRYKSAIETYTREKMSAENREQIRSVVSTIWNQILSYANQKTKISKEKLNQIAGEQPILRGEQALKTGLVDQLDSLEGVKKKLMELVGGEKEPNSIQWSTYYEKFVRGKEKKESKIVAVVFAQGSVLLESPDNKNISSKKLSKTLRKLSKDPKVGAVVLRVDSPGGSALASDIIWRSVKELNKQKPVVASFGSVAASGGYYISAGAQAIFAEPTTITGSIGVFGIKWNSKNFWKNKLGVTFDTEKTNPYADMESTVGQLNPKERSIIQSLMEDIYKDFLNVVVEGRTAFKTREELEPLAQGRIWTGLEAQKVGLVDQIGGLPAAVEYVAKKAQLKDYQMKVYPKSQPLWVYLMKTLGGVRVFQWFWPSLFIPLQEALKTPLEKVPLLEDTLPKSPLTKSLLDDVIQARPPFDLVFD